MVRCEICDSALGSRSEPGSSHASPYPSRPASAAILEAKQNSNFVRLSFRKGGENTFYASLKKALKSKAWDRERTSDAAVNGLEQARKTSAGIGMPPSVTCAVSRFITDNRYASMKME
jgi:ESCRT-II complex subunit VPS36